MSGWWPGSSPTEGTSNLGSWRTGRSKCLRLKDEGQQGGWDRGVGSDGDKSGEGWLVEGDEGDDDDECNRDGSDSVDSELAELGEIGPS